MRELARIAEMAVECLKKDVAFTKVCGACGSNNRVTEIFCPACWKEMREYTIEVSHEMWMCPWCDYPYFHYEMEAMSAKYCKSCHIKWDVELEEVSEEKKVEIPPIQVPVYSPGQWEREYQQRPQRVQTFWSDVGTDTDASTTAGWPVVTVPDNTTTVANPVVTGYVTYGSSADSSASGYLRY